MTTPQSHDEGVLVVHADGAASWWSRRVAAVAEVAVPVGRNAAVQVDAAHPERVLAWSVHSGGDVQALARAFGDPELEDRIAFLTTDSDEVYIDQAPILTEPWVRRATVAAVSQCTVRPVSEGVLSLNRADSEYATGNIDAAKRLFAISAPVLLHLGEQCLDRTLGGRVAADVTRLATVAADALQANGWGPELTALSARLATELGANRELATTTLADWVPSVAVASRLGAADAPAAVWSTYIDPRSVPQRLLAWPGADSPDLIIEIDDDRTVLVSVMLAESVDVRSPDINQLMAYAAATDGQLVAVSPMHVAGRTLTATLQPTDVEPADLTFGVYHLDRDPARLRADPMGQTLIEADRWMLEAFNQHRFAQAVVYADAGRELDEARKRQKTHLSMARTAADNAIEILENAGLSGTIDKQAAAQLLARRTAIAAYRDTFTPDASTHPGWQPLLAEVIAPDPPDADLDD